VHYCSTYPRKLDCALQRAFTAPSLDHHVVAARWFYGSDALTSFVLMRVTSDDSDLDGTHLLGRRGREDADSTCSHNRHPGLRADRSLMATVPSDACGFYE
jgi:hypothetical protein